MESTTFPQLFLVTHHPPFYSRVGVHAPFNTALNGEIVAQSAGVFPCNQTPNIQPIFAVYVGGEVECPTRSPSPTMTSSASKSYLASSSKTPSITETASPSGTASSSVTPAGTATPSSGVSPAPEFLANTVAGITTLEQQYYYNPRPISGFSGDGWLASEAALSFPTGAALDAYGNLFITDRGTNRVRVVYTGTGLIATFAGNGKIEGDTSPDTPSGSSSTSATVSPPPPQEYDTSFFNPATDTPASTKASSRSYTGTVTSTRTASQSPTPSLTVTATWPTGDNGPALQAQLNNPVALAFDREGGLFISESDGCRVRHIVASTITTVAGTGVPGFSGDGGSATNATLSYPFGIAYDVNTSLLFIADEVNHRVRCMNSAGIISTFAGSGGTGPQGGGYGGDGGSATAATLLFPKGVAVAGGVLYIADTSNNRIRTVLLSTGIITTVVGSGVQGFGGDGGSAFAATLNWPSSVVVDGEGNLYISDTFNHRVRWVSAATNLIYTVSGTGITDQYGFGGYGVQGNDLLATKADMNSPNGMVLDINNNVYVCDTDNQRVRLLSRIGCSEVGGVAEVYPTPLPTPPPPSATHLPAAACPPSQFQSVSANDLAGVVSSTALGVPTEVDCQHVCCAVSCRFYSWSPPASACFLLSPNTTLTPSNSKTLGSTLGALLRSGMLVSATPTPTKSGTPSRSAASTRSPTRTYTPTRTHTRSAPATKSGTAAATRSPAVSKSRQATATRTK